MKAIAILPEADDAHPTAFRAVTADGKAVGRTPGEALDALTTQLGEEKAGAAVIVQLFRPDSYFTAEQSERLSTLMARWRTARDAGSALPPAEQAELERLVEEELQGSAERSAQMSRELGTTRELRGLRVDETERLLASWETTTRRLWRVSLLYPVMLTILVCLLLLGVGVVTIPLIALATADIILHLLAWFALRKERLIRRPIKRGALHDASEDSAEVGKQREQAGAR